MIVFWDVDTQNDFMNKNGLLYVPQSEIIKPVLKKLTDFAIEKNISILGSVDRHFPNDIELQKFPPHCMDKTSGQKKIPETNRNCFYVESRFSDLFDTMKYKSSEIIEIVKSSNIIMFEKQSIDVFTNLTVDKILEKLDVTTAVVYGVATEYCIKEAVLGLRKRGIIVYVVSDAIKGINLDDKQKSIKDMEDEGAWFVDSKYIMQSIQGGMK